jgi:hypothetical protein
MWERFSELWCRTMHAKAMWPMHGKYTCPDCLREYPVLWDQASEPPNPEPKPRPRPAFLWFAKRSDTM